MYVRGLPFIRQFSWLYLIPDMIIKGANIRDSCVSEIVCFNKFFMYSDQLVPDPLPEVGSLLSDPF